MLAKKLPMPIWIKSQPENADQSLSGRGWLKPFTGKREADTKFLTRRTDKET
jgi:hypothetical protein